MLLKLRMRQMLLVSNTIIDSAELLSERRPVRELLPRSQMLRATIYCSNCS